MDKDELMLLLHYFGLDENNIVVAFHNPADVSTLKISLLLLFLY